MHVSIHPSRLLETKQKQTTQNNSVLYLVGQSPTNYSIYTCVTGGQAKHDQLRNPYMCHMWPGKARPTIESNHVSYVVRQSQTNYLIHTCVICGQAKPDQLFNPYMCNLWSGEPRPTT